MDDTPENIIARVRSRLDAQRALIQAETARIKDEFEKREARYKRDIQRTRTRSERATEAARSQLSALIKIVGAVPVRTDRAGEALEEPPMWSVDDVQQWLTREGLEGSLTMTLHAWIEKAKDAYSRGEYAFPLDRDAIQFAATPGNLARLKSGLREGTMTRAIVEAYPTEAQLRLRRDGAVRPESEVQRLLDLPITVFMAEQYAKNDLNSTWKERDGSLEDLRKPERIAELASIRWPASGTPMISERIRTHAQALNIPLDGDREDWNRCNRRDRCTEAEASVVATSVYADFPPQPTLRDVQGRASLFFTEEYTCPSARNFLKYSFSPRPRGLYYRTSTGVEKAGIGGRSPFSINRQIPTPTQYAALVLTCENNADDFNRGLLDIDYCCEVLSGVTPEWVGAEAVCQSPARIKPMNQACSNSFRTVVG